MKSEAARVYRYEQDHPGYRLERQRRYRAKHPRSSANAMARYRAAHASLVSQTTGVSQLEKDCAHLYPGAATQYRLPLEGVRRTADYAWPEDKVALFIDGDWWHGCPTHPKRSKTNQAYWDEKVALNQARDRDTDERLAAIGWTSMRLWECEVKVMLQDSPRAP